MNCRGFQERMQVRLDERLSLHDDPILVEHASQCRACANDLEAWKSIELAVAVPANECSLPAKAHSPDHLTLVNVYPILAIAACALLLVGFSGWDNSQQRVAVASVDQVEAAPVDMDKALEAAEWFNSMTKREWLTETMPAVRSMQEGVAPLGRSFVQLVTILTLGDSTFDNASLRSGSADPIGPPDSVGDSSQTS